MAGSISKQDQEFLDAFEACHLEPGSFTHQAHIRLAWINLVNYGIDGAIDATRQQLRAFVKAVGAEDKYHETITVAAVRIVYHFFLKDPGQNFEDFIRLHPRLITGFKELFEAHYIMDVFTSKEAKEAYVEPDREPFD